jgi:hypothetical protein
MLLFYRDDHQNLAFRKVKIVSAKENDHLCIPYGERHLTVQKIRFFTYRKVTYVWHPIELRFATVDQLEGVPTISFIHKYWREQTGLDSAEISRRLVLYGKNLIDVKLKPIIVLLFKECITPFYCFQVFRFEFYQKCFNCILVSPFGIPTITPTMLRLSF